MNDTNNILIGAGTVLINDETLGWTRDGVSINHSAIFNQVFVDQELSPLKTTKVSERYTISTNLAEITLENIKKAWGMRQEIVGVTSDFVDYGGQQTKNRLYFGGDPVNSDLEEYTLDFWGKAPGSNTNRRIHFYKAVSIDYGSMPTQKGGETVLPVTFEALADSSRIRGQQLGYLEDET